MKMKRLIKSMFAVALLGSCANNASTDTRPPKMVLVEYNIASDVFFVDTMSINVNEIENYDSLSRMDRPVAIMSYLSEKLNDRVTRVKIYSDDKKKK